MLHDRPIGWEIIRHARRTELPPGCPFDLEVARAVLGALDTPFLIPINVDVLELGLIDVAGLYELLPVTAKLKPLWDEAAPLVVTESQATRQQDILLHSYRLVRDAAPHGLALHAEVTEWARRGRTHPVLGMIRFATIEAWRQISSRRRKSDAAERDLVHAWVAKRVVSCLGASGGSLA